MWLEEIGALSPEALAQFAGADPEAFAELTAIVDREQWLRSRRQLYELYPDEGALRRDPMPARSRIAPDADLRVVWRRASSHYFFSVNQLTPLRRF